MKGAAENELLCEKCIRREIEVCLPHLHITHTCKHLLYVHINEHMHSVQTS